MTLRSARLKVGDMADSLKNGKGVWFSISLFLAGILLSGSAMVVRGDFLGDKAAEEVEDRMEQRVDRLEERIHGDIQEIKQDVKTLLQQRK